MKSVTFVEIDADHCQLVYGESPCTAALGVTGDRKCYNTRATCQDPQNYDPAPKTIRFAVASDFLNETGIQAIPSVVSVDHTPARIRIAEDLGERASVRVSFQDHPDSDLSQDPYIDERPNPPGTFWGRFRARNVFLIGRPLRWIDGKVGQTLEQMTTRHYIIESIAGPDIAGRVTITAKDPLKLADGDRAKVPALSRGELAASISDTDTTATISPVGIGDLEYPESGKVAIGKEVMQFTRSGDTLTLTRAQSGTEAQEHDAGDRVQLVKIYTAQTSDLILNDLLVNGASIDPALIDLDDWAERRPPRLFEAEIAEPEPVRKLIGEVMENANVTLWFDEIANQIRLRSLEELAAANVDVNEDIILADSYQQRDNPDKRVSQAWVYFGKLNPLDREDEPQNYALSKLFIHPPSQSADQWGRPAIRELFSRWIPSTAGAVAELLAATILRRFIRPPRSFSFSLQSDTKPEIVMGTTVRVFSPTLQNDAGEVVPATAFVTSRADSWGTHQLECEEQTFNPFDPEDPDDPDPPVGVINVPIDEPKNNVNLREAFTESNLGITPDDDTEVVFRIPDGVVIGSDSPDQPALVIGDWPAGATITLRIRPGATVSGAGGAAGDGGTGVLDSQAKDGEDGGLAILAERAISIENEGTIQGGGGGGGGGRPFFGFDGAGNIRFTPGGGGGGGAGRDVGEGAFRDGQDGKLNDGGDGGPRQLAFIGQTGEGGDGGDPGQAGQSGTDTDPTGAGASGPPGAGGAAGVAIDGVSNVTLTGSGTILGAQIN